MMLLYKGRSKHLEKTTLDGKAGRMAVPTIANAGQRFVGMPFGSIRTASTRRFFARSEKHLMNGSSNWRSRKPYSNSGPVTRIGQFVDTTSSGNCP